MVATGKRMRSYRKAMTVLGKIPVAPKPLNLPSQRLENLLGPDVDFVLRGGRLWRSTFSAPGDGEPKPDAESLLRTSGGREEETATKEGKPVVPKGGNGLRGKDTPKNVSSLGSMTELPPSEGINHGQTMHRHAKVEGRRSHASSNPARVTKQETQKLPEPLPPKSGEGKNRGNIPIRYGSFSTLGVPPPGFEDVGPGPVTQSDPFQYEGCYDVPPHRSSTKEREIIVIHMVGHPGICGSYPVQIGYSETIKRLASPPLQFGDFVPNLGLPQHEMLDGVAQSYAGAHLSMAQGQNLYDDHDGFVCYEKDCYRAAHDPGRRRNGRVHGNLRETAFFNDAQRDAHGALLSSSISAFAPRSSSQKHMFKTPGRLRSMHADMRVDPRDTSSAKPVRFTLLKKVSQKKPFVGNVKEDIGMHEVFGDAEVPVGSDSSACVNKKACEKEGECTRLVTQTEPSVGRNVLEAAGFEKSKGGGTTLVARTEASEPEKSFDSLEAPAPQASLPQGTGMRIDEGSVLGQSVEDTVNGCKLEVKHVIFDADNGSTSGLVGEGDGSMSMGKGEVSCVDKEVSHVDIHNGSDSWGMFLMDKQEKTSFLLRSNAKNKHTHPFAAATMDRKVLAQWKPKNIPTAAKPVPKVAKGTRKVVIRMSKSPDVQQRQSCSIGNALADFKQSYEVQMSACEMEGDCLSLDTPPKFHGTGNVIKGERHESGGAGRLGQKESSTPAEKTVNGFKVEVKHVTCSMPCEKDTCLNGVHSAEASSEMSGMECELQTSSHKHNGGKARSNSGSNNNGKDKNLVLVGKVEHKIVSYTWKPKVVALSESKLVTKVSKGSQASATQLRKSVPTPKHQNLHTCSSVGPTACVDRPKSSPEENGPLNARSMCNPQKHSLENVANNPSPTIVSESKQLVWSSQREIGPYGVVEHTGSISASPSSAYANKNVCEGDESEHMSLVTAMDTLKADENGCMGLAGKVTEGHISSKIEAETTAVAPSTNNINRKGRGHERSESNGCKVEVKHVIFDAESCNTNGLMGDGGLDGIAKPMSKVERIPYHENQADHPGPFSAKSYIRRHRTAREEHIHQMVHRKYKEAAGNWNPKAGQAPVQDNVEKNYVDHNENKVEAICETQSQASECSHESKASHSRPFVKKVRHRTAIEEHIHQLVHRKYKETGQWKPKADRQQGASTAKSGKRRAVRQ